MKTATRGFCRTWRILRVRVRVILVDVKLSGDGDQIKGAASDDTTDGEIYAWITYGGQAGFASALRDRPTTSWMPQFGRLLSEEERWELVMLIRAEQAR